MENDKSFKEKKNYLGNKVKQTFQIIHSALSTKKDQN